MGERFSLEDGELVMTRGTFVLPASPEGDYELRVRTTVYEVDADRSAMVVYMPVGDDEAATIRYMPAEDPPAWIENRDHEGADIEQLNRIGRETTLLFQIDVQDEGMAEIAMLIDDELIFRWRGEAEDLWTRENYRPDEEQGNIFRFTCPSSLTLHAIELREHED